MKESVAATERLKIAPKAGRIVPEFDRPDIREVLCRVGRMKYLRPLYKAQGATQATRDLARAIFTEASPSYHSLSRRVVQGVIDGYEETK